MLRIAVLLATYNGEKYIIEQLESIANQSFQDFVCYIHDDGSTDSTVSLCREFCDKHSGRFFLLDYPPTGGAKNNFFSLLKKIEADYYFFSDQDDYWEPNKLEEMLNAAKRGASLCNGCLIYSDLKVVDDKLNLISDSFYKMTCVDTRKINFKNSLVKGIIPGCSMLIDRRLRDKAINYKKIQNIKMHDWWIVSIAFLLHSEILYVNETLVWYRQHTNNAIGAKEISTKDRVKTNIKRFISGDLKRIKKQNLVTPRLQAKELYLMDIGEKKNRIFLKNFYKIGNKNKIQRMYFYYKNFHHVYRLWWMILWA